MFRARSYIVFLLFAFAYLVLSGRLFFLQVMNFEKYSTMALEQHNKIIKIDPVRGAIYDRFMEPLAVNLDTISIYADPRMVDDPASTSDALADKLGLDRDVIFKRLSSGKGFVWIKRKIDHQEIDEAKKIKLKGVFFVTESKRIYPNDTFASHMIGYSGIDNNGLEGLELIYDQKLKGAPGYRHFMRDARLKPVLFDDKASMRAENGENLVLTVDSVVQYIVEEEILKMVEKFNCSSATIAVMEPSTGKMLALANYPNCDLNKYPESPSENRKNISVASVYEPGSAFKIVTASAAIDTDIVKPTDVFNCENGNYNICGRILHDVHPYGNMQYSEVIAKSSNIGTVKSAIKVGPKILFEYIKKFGFGEVTGIDLPGEIPGLVRAPSVWSKSDITTVPIGQGIAVTSMQLLAATAVIANGGMLVKPYIVEKITTMDGEVVEEFAPEIKRRVLKESTALVIKDFLEKVVLEGTGKTASSKIVSICGKTGTAQRVNPAGGYYSDRYQSTFVGFAPKDDPSICMVVTAEDAHPLHYGGTVAGPTFKNITEKIVQYLENNKQKKK
ncbi:MAG: penicillin-binding protein [Candidatus Omnitrophica bacterium]|nr:penicillin-binding protein [Candidatus Omnitrophota bacterium]